VAYKLAALLASQGTGGGPRLRELLQQLRGDRPSDPLLLDALGWAQFWTGEQTRARTLLEAAVKGAPEEPAPHFHLAAIYSRAKMLDRARSELSAALEPGRPFPERLEALRLLRDSSPDPGSRKR
jgi:Flp pilus assembly protein TadD